MAHDILSALSRIVHKFEEMGFHPPAVIHLSERKQGEMLLRQISMAALAPVDFAPETVEIDGCMFAQIVVFGMQVRWPAIRLGIKDGRNVWG